MDVEDPYKVKLYKGIVEKGCCKRCALRYLGYCRNITSFESPDMSLITFGLFSPLEELEMARTEKQEARVCTVCLGLLEDSMIKEMLSHEALEKCAEYAHDSFIPQITFPVSVLVRDYSMKLYLQKTYPEIFKVDQATKINIAWRCSIEKKLSKILEKKYDAFKSNFIVHFNTEYVLEEEETSFIKELVKDSRGLQPGRQHIVQLLEKFPEEKLGSLFNIPPSRPFYAVTLKDLKYFGNPIHLFGSYLKFARELAQAPNPLNPAPNVEGIVSKAFADVCLKVEKITFHVTNCDEIDMRILGQGRFFHLELTDPKFEKLSKRECRKIEKLASRDGLIRLAKLKQMHRKEILHEMAKQNCNPRTYKALCIVMEYKDLDRSVNAVNMYQTITVSQKTPMRVLHQRPYWQRTKTIFYIKAKKTRDNLIEVDICAQSGLYINEFINGDLGRTVPSLSDIMRAKVDVVAMDIIDFQSTASYAADIEDVVI